MQKSFGSTSRPNAGCGRSWKAAISCSSNGSAKSPRSTRCFHKHLDERTAVVMAYREILDGLGQLANQFSDLAERARAQPIPDLDELPTLAEEDKSST